MIDPGIWDSEQVQSLSCRQFKVYVYAFSMADDEGRLKLSWSLMPARVHPMYPEDQKYFRQDIAHLQTIGLVQLYAVNGSEYLVHPNWRKFQKLDHPAKYPCPGPDEGVPVDPSVDTRESVASPRESVASDSEQPARTSEQPRSKRREEKRREEKNTTAAPPAPLDPDMELYHAVMDGMEKRHGQQFGNYAKEGKAVKRLITRAKREALDNPRGFLGVLAGTLWRLKHSGDKFWTEQPFTPSVLDSLYDRIVEAAKQTQAKDDVIDEVLREVGVE